MPRSALDLYSRLGKLLEKVVLEKRFDVKLFLIVDNLRIHRANRVREWAAENTEEIELPYLPPCAPELNPAFRNSTPTSTSTGI